MPLYFRIRFIAYKCFFFLCFRFCFCFSLCRVTLCYTISISFHSTFHQSSINKFVTCNMQHIHVYVPCTQPLKFYSYPFVFFCFFYYIYVCAIYTTHPTSRRPVNTFSLPFSLFPYFVHRKCILKVNIYRVIIYLSNHYLSFCPPKSEYGHRQFYFSLFFLLLGWILFAFLACIAGL